MLTAYRRIFSHPGALAFSSAGLLARLGVAMTRFAIVAMLAQRPSAYALAGAVTATQAISYAVVGPRLARAVDRHGQRRVLLPAAAAGSAALALLALFSALGAPSWTLFVAAAGSGVIPNAGSMVRARWAALLGGTDDLHPAYSLESVVDEVVFTIGPVLAIGLATTVAPQSALFTAAALLLLGSWLLARQTATEPPRTERSRTERRGSALRFPGMPALVVAFLAIGAIFASVEVVTMAFAADLGHKELASPVLAVYAVGSAVAGLVYGGLRPPGTLRQRLVAGAALMTLTMLPLLVADGLLVLGVVLFVAGGACAPTLATALGLIEATVPRERVTEGMTWSSTGLGFGIALGAALAGQVVAAADPRTAFAVPVAFGLLGVAAVTLGLRGVRAGRSPATAEEPVATAPTVPAEV